MRSAAKVDLGELTDREFREVVNADLRRRVHPDGVDPAVTEALRSPANAERWRATLEGMLRSVTGQLAARQLDHEARLLMEPDPATRARLDVEHLRWRSSTERFRTGVEEHLVEAEAACGGTDAPEALRRQVRRLQRAIREHREAVLEDLAGDTPDDIDLKLWDMLD